MMSSSYDAFRCKEDPLFACKAIQASQGIKIVDHSISMPFSSIPTPSHAVARTSSQDKGKSRVYMGSSFSDGWTSR